MPATQDLNEAIQRLRGAVPSAEKTMASRASWLESFIPADEALTARQEGRKPLSAAKLIERKRATDADFAHLFAACHYAHVYPDDVLAACDAAKQRTAVVAALEMGSAEGTQYTAKNEPKKVLILVRDLRHLLEQVQAG